MQHLRAQGTASASAIATESSPVPRASDTDECADEASCSTRPPVGRSGSILPPAPPPPRYTVLPEDPSVPTAEPLDSLADTGPLSRYGAPRPSRRPVLGAPIDPAAPDLAELEGPPSRPLPSLPSTPEAEDIKELIETPTSERAPVSSTWRLKQKYPSYVPPEQNSPESVPGRAFAIKVLDSSAELVSAYRLRYQVFESLGYLQQETRTRLEIDEYDRYAIPFGAIEVQSGELVGTLRLITNCVQSFYARRIQRILDVAGDSALRAHCLRLRKRPLPSIVSACVQKQLDEYNTAGQEVEEMSREIVHPKYRGVGIARGLMEFGLAYAMAADNPLVIAGCLPEHVPINAKYGYEKLPGTELDLYESVGQIANTIVCNTSRLPEPARSRVAMILRAARMGELECILEECPREPGQKRRSIWHFAENYYTNGGNEAIHQGGARYAFG